MEILKVMLLAKELKKSKVKSEKTFDKHVVVKKCLQVKRLILLAFSDHILSLT